MEVLLPVLLLPPLPHPLQLLALHLPPLLAPVILHPLIRAIQATHPLNTPLVVMLLRVLLQVLQVPHQLLTQDTHLSTDTQVLLPQVLLPPRLL